MRIVSLTSAIVLCALFFAAAEENVPEETRGAVAEDAVVAKMERGAGFHKAGGAPRRRRPCRNRELGLRESDSRRNLQ